MAYVDETTRSGRRRKVWVADAPGHSNVTVSKTWIKDYDQPRDENGDCRNVGVAMVYVADVDQEILYQEFSQAEQSAHLIRQGKDHRNVPGRIH